MVRVYARPEGPEMALEGVEEATRTEKEVSTASHCLLAKCNYAALCDSGLYSTLQNDRLQGRQPFS